MIYEEKWLKTHDKPMETVEDALCYVAGRMRCGVCSECPVKLYTAACGWDSNKELNRKVMKLLGADIDFSSDKKVYASINAMEGKVRTSKQSEPKGTCATCKESFEHSPGVRFCKSWHNFTHETGFCYRYDPVIMEEQDPMDMKVAFNVPVDK